MAWKKGLKILMVLLAAFLAIWCLLPQNTFRLLKTDREQIRRAQVLVIENDLGSFNSYQVNSADLDSAMLSELLSILEGKGARPDIRNLLPWEIQEFSGKGQDYHVSVSLSWGTEPGQTCHLSFLEPDAFGTSFNGGFSIFHPVDRETMENLYLFAAKYGEKTTVD